MKNLIDQIISEYFSSSKSQPNTKRIEKEINDLVNSSTLNSEEKGKIQIEPFGEIEFPFLQLGKISSLNFFCLHEFINFAFYYMNKDIYKNVADVGACIGLHTILLSKCGYKVSAFEPDKDNFKLLKKYLSLNNIINVKAYNKAVYDNNTKIVKFNIIHDNKTGNHILGSKKNVYGNFETVEVEAVPLQKLMKLNDFIKLDIEGAESKAILSTIKSDWANCDILLEVHDFSSSKKIFEHGKNLNLNIYSHKNNWENVNDENDMPRGYNDGSILLTTKNFLKLRKI